MPTLPSLKQERFARLLANGEIPGHAFVKAGYSAKGAAANAHKLKNQPKIKARIAEIVQGKIRNGQTVPPPGSDETRTEGEWDWNGEVPVSWVRREINDVLQKAKVDGDHKSALDAIKAMGQTIGMFDQKGRLPGTPGRPRKPDEPNHYNETKERRNDLSGPQVNVQIVNQVARHVGGGTGDMPAEGDALTLDAVATVVGPLLDYRPGTPVPGGGGDEGKIREGVPVGAGSSSAEELESLCGVHDAG